MGAPSEVRTLFAQRAADIAAAFEVEVSRTELQGPVAHRVELLTPEGPSTGGGARAVCHLRLVPLGGAIASDAATQLDLRAGPAQAIVIGSWDQIQRLATLRTWERLAEQYAQRFKARLPVDVAAYAMLLLQLEAFFLERNARVEREDVSVTPRPAEPARVPVASGGRALLALFTGFVGLLLGVVFGAMAMYVVLR